MKAASAHALGWTLQICLVWRLIVESLKSVTPVIEKQHKLPPVEIFDKNCSLKRINQKFAIFRQKSSNLRTFCRKIANFWFMRFRGQFLSKIWTGGSLYFSMTGVRNIMLQVLDRIKSWHIPQAWEGQNGSPCRRHQRPAFPDLHTLGDPSFFLSVRCKTIKEET